MSQQKKIIIIGSAYPLRGGGIASYNERLARAFMMEGFDTSIYTFTLQYPKLLFPGTTQYSTEPPPADLSIKVESIPGSLFLKNIMASEKVSEEKKSAYESKEDSLLYSKSYVIDFTRNGYHYYMICSLIKMDDALFANIEPVDARPMNDPGAKDGEDLFRGGSYIPAHSMAKVVFNGNHMEFRFLDSDFIRNQLINGRVGIKFEEDDLFRTSLITASSNDLQQFLRTYGNEERLYNKENTVTLNKI